MISIQDKDSFDLYYQTKYDFNTNTLKPDEIFNIKNVVKEKRVDYALAPIGNKIFEYIKDKEPNIFFELVELDNESVDGMLYIPKNGEDKAYIIINGNKPLINQIFAATHEYYHYICDYEQIKHKPYICCLSSLSNVNEKRASRFAAEFLLPEQALKNEILIFEKNMLKRCKEFKFGDFACLSMVLTVKYQLPLKAVIYRLHEERYINKINKYIEQYEFIKSVLLQADILKQDINYLYDKKNDKLDNKTLVYQHMKKAFDAGLVTRKDIESDAEKLMLDMDIVHSILGDLEQNEEDSEDTEITQMIIDKWGGLFNK